MQYAQAIPQGILPQRCEPRRASMKASGTTLYEQSSSANTTLCTATLISHIATAIAAPVLMQQPRQDDEQRDKLSHHMAHVHVLVNKCFQLDTLCISLLKPRNIDDPLKQAKVKAICKGRRNEKGGMRCDIKPQNFAQATLPIKTNLFTCSTSLKCCIHI